MSVSGPLVAGRSVPNYELYGELLSGGYRDPVHYETIRERSSRHDWTIRPHRHRGLAQIFLFRTSAVSVGLADRTITTTEPLVLFVPPGVVHGFRFDEGVDGSVLSLRIDDLWGGVAAMLDHPALVRAGALARSATGSFDHIAALFGQLEQVYHGMTAERAALLDGLTRVILAYLANDLRQDPMMRAFGDRQALTRHEKQADKFCALLEAHYRDALSVRDYARAIGMSAPHLTRVCKAVLGSTPNDLVRQRRLLEAQRLLEYTQLPLSEIAHLSGFNDPAYFSRTFRRAYGVPPKTYRDDRSA
jgi:AraC family transcriptional regulator, transcriptional activator of pobA